MTKNSFDTSHEDDWALAEQTFMRVLAGGLLIIAVISMIFGVFPLRGALTQGINVGVTMFLGIGALWSFWWSSDINRMYRMIEDFKENGSGRTYLAAGMQLLIGVLFASELLGGRWTLGAIGLLILASAAFFIWRAQQISKASY